MNYDEIQRVLGVSKRSKIKRSSGSEFVYADCPMAPYSDAHSKNYDSNPSFYVTISSPSFCGCHACGFNKKPFVYLLKDLARLSKHFIPAYELAVKYDTKNLHRRDTGFKAGFTADRTIYTGYEERFRADMDVMPWDWLDSKGVHEKGVETFKIGLDVASGSVVLPSIDLDGEVVGAQARTIYQGTEKAKYVTILRFPSKSNFFGEHLLNLETQTVVIFEGPFDAVHAWEEGVENTLAVYGSALHEGQILKLKNWGIQICHLMLDPDAAGESGITESKALVERLYPELVIYTPTLPCDPKKMSADQFNQAINQENVKWLKKSNRKSLERAMMKLTSPSAGRKKKK